MRMLLASFLVVLTAGAPVRSPFVSMEELAGLRPMPTAPRGARRPASLPPPTPTPAPTPAEAVPDFL